jgi:hypothetical protein
VALLFDEERAGQARFVHDPDAGDSPGRRITIHHLPERADVGRGRRAPIWLEEIDHLEALAGPPAAATVGSDDDTDTLVPAAEGGDSADQLAAWLLTQTNLEGL